MHMCLPREDGWKGIKHMRITCAEESSDMAARAVQVMHVCYPCAVPCAWFGHSGLSSGWFSDSVCVCECLCACWECAALTNNTNPHKQTNTYTSRGRSNRCPFLARNQTLGIELADEPVGLVVRDALLLGTERSSQGTHALVPCLPYLQGALQFRARTTVHHPGISC